MAYIRSLTPIDLANEHKRFIIDLEHVLAKSLERIQRLENSISVHLLSANGQFIKAIVDGRRITSALQIRYQQVYEALQENSYNYQKRALEVMTKSLELPKDTINSLIDAADLPPIAMTDLEQSLETLLGAAERVAKKLDVERAQRKIA